MTWLCGLRPKLCKSPWRQREKRKVHQGAMHQEGPGDGGGEATTHRVVVDRDRDAVVLLDHPPLLEFVKDLEPLDPPQVLPLQVQPARSAAGLHRLPSARCTHEQPTTFAQRGRPSESSTSATPVPGKEPTPASLVDLVHVYRLRMVPVVVREPLLLVLQRPQHPQQRASPELEVLEHLAAERVLGVDLLVHHKHTPLEVGAQEAANGGQQGGEVKGRRGQAIPAALPNERVGCG